MNETPQLDLNNQICFPFYAISRLITRAYQPLLEAIELTYPQYLVMLVMWEHKKLKVGEIGEKLILNSNTLTPLIKKLIEKELLSKERSKEDERSVYVELTQQGIKLKDKAKDIPLDLLNNLNAHSPSIDAEALHKNLWELLGKLKDNEGLKL